MPDQATMYQMVQDVKLGFASITMPTQGDIVVKYPEDPSKLSSQLYAQHTHASIAKSKPVLPAPSAGSVDSSSSSATAAMAPLVEVAAHLAAIVKDIARKPSSDELELTMNNKVVHHSSAELESFKPKLRTCIKAGLADSSQADAASDAAPLALENGDEQPNDTGDNAVDGAAIEQAAYDACCPIGFGEW
eukprot:s3233_g5.t1